MAQQLTIARTFLCITYSHYVLLYTMCYNSGDHEALRVLLPTDQPTYRRTDSPTYSPTYYSS